MNRSSLRKGDWIKCSDDEEIRELLSDLSKEGYGAVRSPGHYILITAEPKEDKQNGEQEELPQDR